MVSESKLYHHTCFINTSPSPPPSFKGAPHLQTRALMDDLFSAHHIEIVAVEIVVAVGMVDYSRF